MPIHEATSNQNCPRSVVGPTARIIGTMSCGAIVMVLYVYLALLGRDGEDTIVFVVESTPYSTNFAGKGLRIPHRVYERDLLPVI